MSKEMCYVIDQLSREKGITRDALLQVLETAMLSAVRKKFGGRLNINLTIDSKTCDIQVYETKRIVEEVIDKDEEVALEKIRETYPNKALGDTLDFPIPLQDLGRIAAQTAKQVIFQKVRDAERDIIFEEYKDKVGQIISGTVLRKEKGNYYISLSKTEGVLPQRE
ncbi:MAG: NusA N-terminal domain-containing protein, partial [Thermodesulfovibrionales bacterium]